MIYHVATNNDWEKAQTTGLFEVPSLQKEGFIHCSTAEQVQGVLDRYYKDQTNLVLLHINEELLIPALDYEFSTSVNEEFPHVFGAINIDAVLKVENI